MKRRFKRAFAVAFLLLLSGTMLAHAESAAVSEAAVKAVLLFKLPRFVYLPDSADERKASICILHQRRLGRAVEKLVRATTNRDSIRVRELTDVYDSAGCDFLFIGDSQAHRLRDILDRLDGKPMVTVSDIQGFAHAGGMVELASKPDRSGVQILINRRAAKRLDIAFNAQLLRLAKIVEP